MRQPLSIDVLAAEVHQQLAAQLRHFERLDSQAGVLLGFSGLFVALAPGTSNGWLVTARLGGVVAALGALLAFLDVRHPVMDLTQLRGNYLSADPFVTKLTLLDTHIVFVERARRLTNRKATRLRVTICALSVAIALAAVGVVVDNLG